MKTDAYACVFTGLDARTEQAGQSHSRGAIPSVCVSVRSVVSAVRLSGSAICRTCFACLKAFQIFWKTALNLVSQAQYGRISKKRLMFKAALEPELFLKSLFSSKK